MKKTSLTLLAAVAGWLATSATVGAQTATPPKSETIQLSPFEVLSEKDTGYRANGTLAGTRLRTDLKDVAASVSVITKDFMNDLGANNLAELLVYTTGTEVSGLGGNMSSFDVSAGGVDPEQVNRQPASVVRIRSIGSGTTGSDQARDFSPPKSLPMATTLIGSKSIADPTPCCSDSVRPPASSTPRSSRRACSATRLLSS